MRTILTAAIVALAFFASAVAADAAPFGAIASSASGAFGYSGDQATLYRAEAVALYNCRARTRYYCAVRIWWAGYGMCGALARNYGRQGWGYGRGGYRARVNALSGAGGGYILVTACN
ncbi:MAG TPA: DUF4189 domain-containing protein [Candidatus Tyrphobacter sp.]